MSALNKEMLAFDRDDVKTMQQMLKKFDEFHQGTGLPDYSTNHGAYLPVFAIALLISQKAIEKFGSRLDKLTWALVLLTALMAILMIAQFVQPPN